MGCILFAKSIILKQQILECVCILTYFIKLKNIEELQTAFVETVMESIFLSRSSEISLKE